MRNSQPRKRFTREERQLQILGVLWQNANVDKPAKLTEIAEAIHMKPSTSLRAIIDDLIACRVVGVSEDWLHNGRVRFWYDINRATLFSEYPDLYTKFASEYGYQPRLPGVD